MRFVEFLRRRFPYKLVPKVDENSLEEFLSGWEDNRVRGLIFEPRNTTRLRYLVTAFHFRHRVAFGCVTARRFSIKDDYKHEIL